jgi:DNA-binding PadR family transcriptional regulator
MTVLLSESDISVIDMKGYLKIFVLRELMQKELTGSDLMKQFGVFCGSTPSPGTIYPLLNDLLKKKLISVRKIGKNKIYCITVSGKQILAKLTEERKKALKNIMPVLGTVYNKKELEGIHNSLVILHSGKHNLPDMDLLRKMKNSIIDFVTSKKYFQKRREFRKLIEETAEQVRRLNR